MERTKNENDNANISKEKVKGMKRTKELINKILKKEPQREYYQTRKEVETARKPGQRVYFSANKKAYYLVT